MTNPSPDRIERPERTVSFDPADRVEAAAADETELDALYQRQAQAWADGDGTAFAATFTRNADFVAVTGEHIRGRQALAASMQQGLDTFMAGTRWSEPAGHSIRFLAPDTAVMITTGVCVLRADQAECRPDDLSIQTRVAIKRGGEWLFTTFHNSRIRGAE